MKLSKSIGRSIYNKVWSVPNGAVGNFLRRRCDGIPENRRLAVIAVLLSLFILTAFFVFGNACYRIGRGHAAATLAEPAHIEGLDITVGSDGGSPDMDNKTVCGYGIPEFENED